MRKIIKAAAGAIICAGALALTVTSATAEIVCNKAGECWHIKRHIDYKPEFGVVVHPDGWAWGAGDHYVWREHRGRGYWRDGVWIKF